MVSNITSVNGKNGLKYSDIMALTPSSNMMLSDNVSIFEKAFGNNSDENISEEESSELLYSKLAEIEDEQGIISGSWNNFKELVNVGTSEEKCEKIIEQYEQGDISFEEAEAAINNYDLKSESSLNLFANILTGCAALAAAASVAATGGMTAPIVAGILAGAGTKTVFKGFDRATNDIKGDTIEAKQLAKDALSGALTGGIAVATAGTGANTYKKGLQLGSKTFKGTSACALKSAKTGIITGSLSGASNYSLDCAFDDDKEFKAKECAANTLTGAAVGGTVGVLMGGLNGTLRANNILQASDTNVVTNATSSAGYKITNDRIRSILN